MLITEKYRALNKELHETRQDYGSNGHKWAKVVSDLCRNLKTNDVVDYGCGKGTLRKNLPGVNIKNYDPAVDEFSKEPEPADIVCCFDVLEHIEPDCLEDVIDHLAKLAKVALVLVVATRKAKKFLSNGENAHLIVNNLYWWMDELSHSGLQLQQLNNVDDMEFLAIYKNPNYQHTNQELKL